MSKLPDDYRPPYEPRILEKRYEMERLQKEIVGAIEDGLPIGDAFELAGISKSTYKRWVNKFVEDTNYGYTGTNLIIFMTAIIQADKRLFRRVSKKMFSKAVDEGDTRMLMYLGDNRFGYAKKRKNNVEISSADKTPVQINVVNMKSIEADENEVIDVYGESRDDPHSTEVD